MSHPASTFQHFQTQDTIRETGRRVESAIHAGMLSLATAQAKAMKDLGTRIDDRLVQIDDTLLEQSRELSLVRSGLGRMHGMISDSFSALDMRMGEMEERLSRIEDMTSNPERTRAFERFRRAVAFYKNADFARALEAVDFAIGNDGGPAFEEIPEFHLLRGHLLAGTRPHEDNARLVDLAEAHRAFATAARHTRLYRERGPLHMAAGQLAERVGMLAEAHSSYQSAVRDLWTLEAHFASARIALQVGDTEVVKEQLLEAVTSDWNALVVAAADPVCIEHAEIVEPILRDYAEAEKARLTEGLRALCDMLGGPAEQNLRAARDQLRAASENLGPDVAASPDRDRLLTAEEQAELRALLDPELGLLDIRAGLRSINARKDHLGNHAIETALTLTETAWTRFWEILEDIVSYASEGRIHPHVGLPTPHQRRVPPQIETRGLRGLLGMKSAETRRREAAIEKIEAHNAENQRVLDASKKVMKEEFMPALNEARRVAHRTLQILPVARQAFIDGVQDPRVEERMKNRESRKASARRV